MKSQPASCQMRPFSSALSIFWLSLSLLSFCKLALIEVQMQIRSNRTYSAILELLNLVHQHHTRSDMIEFFYGSVISLAGSSACFPAPSKDVPHIWNLIAALRTQNLGELNLPELPDTRQVVQVHDKIVWSWPLTTHDYKFLPLWHWFKLCMPSSYFNYREHYSLSRVCSVWKYILWRV